MDYEKKIKNALSDKSVPFEVQAWLEEQFPELKESEDEKVRKEILSLFKENRDGISHICNRPACERYIAYLEKQGEKDEEILILKDQVESLHAAIKALKEVHKIELEKQGEQKSAEWSEEEEQTFIKAVEALEDFGKFELADWLKEHKNQSISPQSQWKPSKKQMDLLREVQLALLGKDCHNGFVNFMYELKRLGEE